MLWNYIRDFFVQYIFGGTDSNLNVFGGFVALDNNTGDELYTDGFSFTLNNGNLISIGDWLSTSMTIICMVLISICFILLIRWIFKAVTSAFLLK